MNLGIPCAFWPYPAVIPTGAIHAAGVPPILVVGTLDDPITPVAGPRPWRASSNRGISC